MDLRDQSKCHCTIGRWILSHQSIRIGQFIKCSLKKGFDGQLNYNHSRPRRKETLKLSTDSDSVAWLPIGLHSTTKRSVIRVVRPWLDMLVCRWDMSRCALQEVTQCSCAAVTMFHENPFRIHNDRLIVLGSITWCEPGPCIGAAVHLSEDLYMSTSFSVSSAPLTRRFGAYLLIWSPVKWTNSTLELFANSDTHLSKADPWWTGWMANDVFYCSCSE